MADSNITILDSTGTARPVDAQNTGTDFQQTVTIGDGANAGRVASITPGTALQVNIAQSGGVVTPVTQALTATGAPTLAGTSSTTGSAVIDVSMSGNASFHLLSAAFVGTVVFEQSFDPAGANGTWAPVPCVPEDALSAPMSSLAINTAVAYVRQFTQGMFGPALFRVRVTAFTSGSLTAYLKAGPGWYEGQPALAPSAANIGTVNVNPTGGTTVTPVAGVAAAQTPPASGGTGVVNLTITAITAAASLIAAPGAGLSIYVTDMEGSNSGATGTLLSLFEGTTGLRYARFMAASGGGFVTNLATPWKLPANTAVGYANSAATTSAYLSVNYFISP